MTGRQCLMRLRALVNSCAAAVPTAAANSSAVCRFIHESEGTHREGAHALDLDRHGKKAEASAGKLVQASKVSVVWSQKAELRRRSSVSVALRPWSVVPSSLFLATNSPRVHLRPSPHGALEVLEPTPLY